ESIRVCRELRLLKRDGNVTLGRQVINLLRLHFLEYTDKTVRISHVAVVEEEPGVGNVRIAIEMVDTFGVEQGCASLDSVHLIALGQKKIREICPILSRDAGDQSFFHFEEQSASSAPAAGVLPVAIRQSPRWT